MSNPTTDTAFNPSSTVSVGVASGTLVAANPYRVEVYIKNVHATQAISLNLGTQAAVINEGIVLAAGEGIVIDTYKGAITAIATGAATTTAIAEI